MTEIIIAIILHLSTILGGVPSEKGNVEKDENENKGKVENPYKGSGGSGNWEDGGK